MLASSSRDEILPRVKKKDKNDLSGRIGLRGHSGTLAEPNDPILRLWRTDRNSWRRCRRTVDAYSRRSWGTRRSATGSRRRARQALNCSGSTRMSTSPYRASSASPATSGCGQSVPLAVSLWRGSGQSTMCGHWKALTTASGATSSSLPPLSRVRERSSSASTSGGSLLGSARSSLRNGLWTDPESFPIVAMPPSIPGYYWAPARILGQAALHSTPGATAPQSSTHTEKSFEIVDRAVGWQFRLD